MPDKNQHYALDMLKYYGFIVRPDPSIKNIAFGRADICAVSCLGAINIEVKQADTEFPFNEWRENQREWSIWSTSKPYNVPYWLYLTLGKNRPDANPKKYDIKRTWLIPNYYMLNVIKMFDGIRKSIPYKIKKGTRGKGVKENMMDAITLFSDFELKWVKQNSLEKPYWYKTYIEEDEEKNTVEINTDKCGGFWIVPSEHKFAQDGWTKLITNL
jgi:hypothetical protein